MARVQPRRNFFQELCEVAVNVTAEKFVDVETFAVEVRDERCVFLSCCLQKDVDEKRAAGKLLDQQIACDFACGHVLASRDVFDEARGFGRVELFETQSVEQFEVTLRLVRGLEDLAAQSGEHERKPATSEDTQNFRAQHHRTIQDRKS